MRLDHITPKLFECVCDIKIVVFILPNQPRLSRFEEWGQSQDSDPGSSPSLPGSNSEQEPPDPISNSEVKMLSADDSVGSPHVKVGHCQAFK